MAILKRAAGAVMVVCCFIILSSLSGAEAKDSVKWEIKAYDDYTIHETVVVKDGDIKASIHGWEKTTSGDITTWTRTVDDWKAYNDLDDRLPIEAQTRNFILWQKTSLLATADKANSEDLYSLIKDQQKEMSIIISIPGYISYTNGYRSSEMSAMWQLDDTKEMEVGALMLKAVTFDGLLVGITGVLLGLIIIGIVYMRRMKKIEKLMEEEYSLENIDIENLHKQAQEQGEDSTWI